MPSRLSGEKGFFTSPGFWWRQQTLACGRHPPTSAVVTWLLPLRVCVSTRPSYEAMATGFRAQPAPVWASQAMLVVKNLPASAGDARDTGSILGSRRSPGEGNGNPFQYSCLENPMDRGARQTYFR